MPSAIIDRVNRVRTDRPRTPVSQDSESSAALSAIEALAGNRRDGQGFSVDGRLRRAIENVAMEAAIEFYREDGWSVEDVSATQPFDLLCTRPGTPELHVEVKGTASDGDTVLLPLSEVAHARKHHPNVALFVVSNIDTSAWPAPLPHQGGRQARIRIFEPWQIEDGGLHPIGYEYSLPSAASIDTAAL